MRHWKKKAEMGKSDDMNGILRLLYYLSSFGSFCYCIKVTGTTNDC